MTTTPNEPVQDPDIKPSDPNVAPDQVPDENPEPDTGPEGS